MPVVVEDIANVTTLNDGAPSLPHQGLNLVEENVVKLLTRKGITRFKTRYIFFRKCDPNAVAFWGRKQNPSHTEVRGRFEMFFYAQSLDVAQRLSANCITTDFVARPRFFLDQQNSLSFHGKVSSSRRTTGPATNDNDIIGATCFRGFSRVNGLLPRNIVSCSRCAHDRNGEGAPFEDMLS